MQLTEGTRTMKKRVKWIPWLAAGIAVLLVVLFWRGTGKEARAEESDHDVLRPVAVALVRRGDINHALTLSGAFRPYQEVDVHAKVAGFIRHIYVDVGDKVRQGQVLAILEVPELNAEILGAEATIRRSQDAIHRSESEVARAASSHAATHSAYERLKQASDARAGLIAQQELDDALAKDLESEAQVDSAKAAMAEARSQLSVSEASRKQLTALEDYTRIVAPFSGVVTKRYADTGALIQAGTSSNTQAMPVVRLAEWSKLRLVFPVPESAAPLVRLGSSVQVRVPALNRTVEGRVTRFSDELDVQTRTMSTEIDFDNRDGSLIDGMYAEADLQLSHKNAALLVPIQSIQRTSSGASVMIVNRDGRIEERQIKLGQEGNNQVEVLSGLAENDQVIVGNRGDITPGERVTPQPISEPKSAEAGS
jgi:RND family efflux transporter MFP subunit